MSKTMQPEPQKKKVLSSLFLLLGLALILRRDSGSKPQRLHFQRKK
ncbi:hypothetical protein [Acinetobacter sp. ANC 3813]|nr:hypothetical protein [Acinetobacter sp. ANC 3813]